MVRLSVRSLVPPAARLGEFRPLLVSLVMIVVLSPALEANRLFAGALISVVLLAGILAVRRDRAILIATFVLVIPALMVRWMSVLLETGQLTLAILSHCLIILYLAFIGLVVLLAVLGHERVTSQTIVGAVCVYLLIAFVFSFVYAIAELLMPGSLEFSEALMKATGGSTGPAAVPGLLYFSFVTLTTLGYGDVTPVSAVARSMAITETLAGQLFLASFVARLVGSMISAQADSSNHDDSSST